MDEEIEAVYKYKEDSMLPDWSQYGFFTAQDAIEFSILQGGLIGATAILSSFVMGAGEEDFEDAEFQEIIGDLQTEVNDLIDEMRGWWKERER